jgi:putative nucleotidyltransferase with HDIG domain
MTSPIDRARARAAFGAYVAPYDAANPRIALKVDHTLRVADLCDRVAASLGLAGFDRDLAWLCGLLHDIGRFEQVRRWDTFSDARSCSHAALGIEVLFDEGRLADFADLSDADRALVRTAVAEHSAFRLPEGLDARTRRYCDLVRDADKVDILKAACTEPVEAIFGVGRDELLASPLSPAVEEAFYAHRTVRREERRFPADYALGFSCFVYELVYPESLAAAREQGHVFELLGLPFTEPDTARRMARATEHLRTWMESRPCTC